MASLGLDDQILSRTRVTQSQLKRSTCNLCRERKVRCDREKPQCQRCRKSGHECIYPPERTDNDEIKSALNFLHSRLLQAETKLQEQEQGFQITTTESMKPSSGSSFSVASKNSQLGYDLVLQGEEMNFSNVVFSEFDHSSYHQPSSLVDSVNGSGPDEAQSELDLNMSDPRTEVFSVSDINAAVPADFASYMWHSTAMVNEEPLGPSFNKQFERTAPVMGIEQQCQPYFDIVQKHMMLIDQQEFLQSIISVETHQCMALKYAVAMSGLNACGESALAMESYLNVRFHLEKAENLTDISSFLNIETVQALLLVARFECTHVSGPKGLLTIARLMQLIGLLGYDMLDQSSLEDGKDSSHILLSKPHSSGSLQKIRQTYWIAFSIHCNAAASFPCCVPVKDEGICTAMPVPDSSMDSDTDQIVYLSEEITQSMARGFSVFSLFILAMKLVVCGDRHRQMTKKYVSDTASDYNFCLVHEKIGREVTITFNSLSTPEFLSGPDTELRVLTFIIILGVRIDWFKTAVLGSQKAEFLSHIARERRNSCLAVANSMCDLLLQADITGAKQITAYKEMSLFIMRPLALAAEVQLDILKNPQDMGSNVFSTTREIRQNLQTICNVMSICKPATGEYNLKIQACLSFLDKTKLERVFSTGFPGKAADRG